MRLGRLATSREFTLSVLVLVLLSLTGSASRVPTDALPQTPSAHSLSGPAAVPTPRPVRASPIPTG